MTRACARRAHDNAGRTPSIVFVLFALGLAAACQAPADQGGTRWQKPDVDETQMLTDEQDCRRRATAEVERETRRERIFGDDGLARPGTLDAMMTRHEANRRTDRLASECMRRLGYAPAPR